MKNFFRAQSTIEFIMVIIFALGAVMVMGPYVIKSVNAYMHSWEVSSEQTRHDPGVSVDPYSVLPIPTSCYLVNCQEANTNWGSTCDVVYENCTGPSASEDMKRCCTYVNTYVCHDSTQSKTITCAFGGPSYPEGCECVSREQAVIGTPSSPTPICTDGFSPSQEEPTECNNKAGCASCSPCLNCFDMTYPPDGSGDCDGICQLGESCSCQDCAVNCDDGVCTTCEREDPDFIANCPNSGCECDVDCMHNPNNPAQPRTKEQCISEKVGDTHCCTWVMTYQCSGQCNGYGNSGTCLKQPGTNNTYGRCVNPVNATHCTDGNPSQGFCCNKSACQNCSPQCSSSTGCSIN